MTATATRSISAHAPTASAGRTREGRPDTATFLLTGLGGFLVSLDVSIANSLLPAIGAGFDNAPRVDVSWIITGYAIVFAAALVPAGRLADRAGRLRTYRYGLLVFGVGSAVCGCAANLPMLVGGRLVQGVGAAAASPASLGLLLASTHARHRSLYTGRYTGVAALGVCLGPLLGGAVTEAGSWRWAFLVNVPLVVAAGALAPRVLRETPRHPNRRLPDPFGAVLLAGSAATLTLGISEATTWGLTTAGTVGSLCVGAGLAAVFIRRCRNVADPLLDLGLFRRRQFALAIVTTALYACGFFGLLLTFVVFFVERWHVPLAVTGLELLPLGCVVLLMTTSVGSLATTVGYRLPIVVGLGCMAAGLLLSARFFDGTAVSASWYPVAALIGFGIGLCYPLLGAAAVAGLPPTQLAAAAAVSQCARQIGAALGVAVAVALLGPGEPAPVSRFHAAWVASAAFCAAAALISSHMPRRAEVAVTRERPQINMRRQPRSSRRPVRVEHSK